MKIAVVGGGTAGFIAATHLSAKFPEADLLHVFDSTIPTIGVGEGTTPRFPLWFHEVTGSGFEELADRCRATLKRGSWNEGWGSAGTDFFHRFQPVRLHAYHVDAAQVVHVLADYVRAAHADAHVTELQATSANVRLRLADGSVHLCDYVFDARGFPRTGGGNSQPADDLISLDWIPTGRGMLRMLPPRDAVDHTRIVARPHGWVFQIPLRGSTSCGYIYNPLITSDGEVDADFTAFLTGEEVHSWVPRGALSFPNFIRRRWFDGHVFRIGNTASFIEPLEATAIGTAIVQVRLATQWIEEHGTGSGEAGEVEALNRMLLSYVCRDSLFISWHYSCGSRWDTPFWEFARCGIERAYRSELARPHLVEMERFVRAGGAVPDLLLSGIEDQEQWNREIFPRLSLYRPFGNFSELNFSQVGHGIGYYRGKRAAQTVTEPGDYGRTPT